MTCNTRHSSAAGLAATRGGETSRLGALAMPASSNSSTSGPTLAEVAFIASARASLTRLNTNSPVSRTLARLSPSFSEEKPMIGGREEKALKKL
jgi:hypothetical protein